ncbi:MAG: DsbA family protein [Anaerolineae bacterium]|nr:DsbA family protein [Anaerolineae bacterium]
MNKHLLFLWIGFWIALTLAVIGLSGCAATPSAAPLTPVGKASPTSAPAAVSSPTSAPGAVKGGLKPLPPTGKVDGIPVGFTKDGHAYRGDPNAPVVMVEYSEFQCPYCRRHEHSTAPQIKETYERTGKVLHIFRDFPLEELHPQSLKAAEAARCAGEQGAEQFWRMHDLLFANAEQWIGQPNAVDTFKSYAQELKLDTSAFDDCLDHDRPGAAIDADLAAGQNLGVRGTPTFILNGYPIVGAQPFKTFQAAIDALVKGNPPPTPEPPHIPYWATAEGMSPDPNHPGYTKAGDAFKGDPDAKVIMIEFADFQCPYCRVYAVETVPRIDATYVDTGMIRVIYKHFPIPSLHPHALEAAIAAECAGQQGKFWEMHDRLFATQDAWAPQPDVEITFSRMAQEIGLDMDAYRACVENPKIADKVKRDLGDGQKVGIRGTPSFIVLKGQRGQLIRGAFPFDKFKQVLDAALTAK